MNKCGKYTAKRVFCQDNENGYTYHNCLYISPYFSPYSIYRRLEEHCICEEVLEII